MSGCLVRGDWRLCNWPGSPRCGDWAGPGLWPRTCRTGLAREWGWHSGTSSDQRDVTEPGGTGSVSSPSPTCLLYWTRRKQSWSSTSSALKLILSLFLVFRKYLINKIKDNFLFCLYRTTTCHLWPISIGSFSLVLDVFICQLQDRTDTLENKPVKKININFAK